MKREVALLLGSDIGLWVAETVEVSGVSRITTEDPEIAAVARARGLRVGPLGEGDRALAVHYPRLLHRAELEQFNAIYNLHPGFLPWGRGHFPLVWAIANREPAGVTLHRMIERLDAGPIVDQVEVSVRRHDTAGDLFRRIRRAERRLFALWWPRLQTESVIPERPQPPGGSYHDRAAFESLLLVDIGSLTPADLDRIRRATTFPNRRGVVTGSPIGTSSEAASFGHKE